MKKNVIDLEAGDIIEYAGGVFYEISHKTTVQVEGGITKCIIHYWFREDNEVSWRIVSVKYNDFVSLRIFDPSDAEDSREALKALSGL